MIGMKLKTERSKEIKHEVRIIHEAEDRTERSKEINLLIQGEIQVYMCRTDSILAIMFEPGTSWHAQGAIGPDIAINRIMIQDLLHRTYRNVTVYESSTS
eukprot:127113-Hanusia_phi.AAC.1